MGYGCCNEDLTRRSRRSSGPHTLAHVRSDPLPNTSLRQPSGCETRPPAAGSGSRAGSLCPLADAPNGAGQPDASDAADVGQAAEYAGRADDADAERDARAADDRGGAAYGDAGDHARRADDARGADHAGRADHPGEPTTPAAPLTPAEPTTPEASATAAERQTRDPPGGDAVAPSLTRPPRRGAAAAARCLSRRRRRPSRHRTRAGVNVRDSERRSAPGLVRRLVTAPRRRRTTSTWRSCACPAAFAR